MQHRLIEPLPLEAELHDEGFEVARRELGRHTRKQALDQREPIGQRQPVGPMHELADREVVEIVGCWTRCHGPTPARLRISSVRTKRVIAAYRRSRCRTNATNENATRATGVAISSSSPS